jgi:hypothetical protein
VVWGRGKTSAYVLCESEAPITLRHHFLGFSFVYPMDVRNLSLGALELYKWTGLPWFRIWFKGHKGPV